MNRRQALQTFAAVATYAATRRGVAQTTVNPLTLPLVTSSTPLFTYLGSFKGPSDGSFAYGGKALSVAGNSLGTLGQLYANGIQQGSACAGCMNIPSPAGPGGTYAGTETATTVVPGTNSVPITLGGTSVGWPAITGTLVYGGRLFVTAGGNYNTSGDNTAFMVVGNTNFTGFGAGCGVTSSFGTNIGCFSTAMGIVPSLWQPYLGKAFFCGGIGGTSGVWFQTNGFGFSTFDPGAVVSGNPVVVKEWLQYQYNTSGGGISVLSGYSPSSKSNWGGQHGDNYVGVYSGAPGTCFIAPGSRSLLFLHDMAYGPYGAPHSDPCSSGSSGSLSTPISPDTLPYRRLQVTAYDLAAVIANNLGGGGNSTMRPYAWWEVPNWSTILGTCGGCAGPAFGLSGWIAFDNINKLLYMGGDSFSGANGTVYVFNVAGGGGGSPPVPNSPNSPILTVS